jgi:flagellar basal-body rod modification protein FlgD
MATTVTGTGSTTGTNATGTTSSSATSALGQIPNDMFLQLFAKQLQYQDPTSPMDTDQFLGQLTQLTTVEGITKMSSGIESIGTKLEQLLEATTNSSDLNSLTALDAGASLLGKYVQYGNSSADAGTVDQIRQSGGQYLAVVDGQLVPIGSLISVTDR